MELKDIFGRFVGKEIKLNDEEKVIKFRGGEHPYHEYSLVEDDPVVKEMQEAAKEYGLSIRFLWTGADTDGYEPERVNVHLERTEQGNWRVTDQFDLH